MGNRRVRALQLAVLATLLVGGCGSESAEAALTSDLTYVEAVGGVATDGRLDVYAPPGDGPHPSAVVLHGGGADRADPQVVAVARALASEGIQVFVPTHSVSRVAPDQLLEADGRLIRDALEEVTCAVKFAQAHAERDGSGGDRPTLVGQSAGGFLGLPPSETPADMRVVDIYRRDGDKLAENWVFIDLLHWLDGQGLDVLARLQEVRR